MDRTISTIAPATPPEVHQIVADLGTYQHWLALVHRVEPAPAAEADEGPAWWVTLRAKVGPFAGTKRLRMVQVAYDPPDSVRFERRETDGRDHSAWVMAASVSPTSHNSESDVEVRLRYDGQLWNGALDTVLGSAIDGAVRGLSDYVAQRV